MNSNPPNPQPAPYQSVRVAISVAGAGLCVALIAVVFWYQDFRYDQPTPTPADFHPPALGTRLPPLPELASRPNDPRPVLLHFFNQDCPCSRFNIDQARSLADQFGGQVRFVLVLQLDEKEAAARQRALAAAAKKFGGVEGVIDPAGKIAEHYGVYSTPQAVILSAAGGMLYRGNYNVSRYCTDPGTEFARLALEAVLADRRIPYFSPLAYQAYGCELPQASTR